MGDGTTRPESPDRFTAALKSMTGDDLRRVATSIGAEQICDEVDWWRATIAIDKLLRRTGCSRRAARAAADAAHAVQEAADRAGILLPDADVTRVARAAAEIARGLAAGPPARPVVGMLLEHWDGLATPV
ncbi:MAG TPA: hypothetical protein VG869_07740 [Acidimicrobiia bacterium]|nr:hypothetical protein [Acidimicrobiia bacterium]HEV3451082.1 hypothetical protein [Acidimicrobiia bacterium]